MSPWSDEFKKRAEMVHRLNALYEPIMRQMRAHPFWRGTTSHRRSQEPPEQPDPSVQRKRNEALHQHQMDKLGGPSVFRPRDGGPIRFFGATEEPSVSTDRNSAKKLEIAGSIIVALLLSIMPERTPGAVVIILAISFVLMLLAIWDDPRFGATWKKRATTALVGFAVLFAYGVWAWPQPKSNLQIIRLEPPPGYRINGNLIVPATPETENGERRKRTNATVRGPGAQTVPGPKGNG